VSNPEITMTLEEGVGEVLGQLTGMDLVYLPELDRFRAVTRALNKALRLNALEKEWSYYSGEHNVGTTVTGDKVLTMSSTVRPRMIGDDAARLVKVMEDDTGHEHVVRWAYYLPRDALHKYEFRNGLWCSVVRNQLHFSRYLTDAEGELEVYIVGMREPVMFRLPGLPEDAGVPIPDVPAEILNQEIDFAYPDVITMRAAYLYAQSDPVMQPRVQTLEAQYKDLMYQVIERDDRNTDSPYLNEWFVPIQGGLRPAAGFHGHPHADERRA
jgi:hypothetical protein